MTVYPYRPQIGEPIWLPAAQWARRMREDQLVRRMTAAEKRAAHRLGSDWHVIEWPNLKPLITHNKTTPLPGFLAIGPGGIFSVSLAQHGRSRVLIAGDIVQIQGKRPSYVPQARRDAKQVSKALSAAIGQELQVHPILVFVGSGLISVNGLPKDCVVTSYRELDKVLAATGRRISANTAEKLSQVARNPTIWTDGKEYQWYPEGATPGDKGALPG